MEKEAINDSNILARFAKSALLNKHLSSKYSDFIFGGDSGLEELLDYASDELKQLLALDPKGEKMLAYQRARIKKVTSTLLPFAEIINKIEKDVKEEDLDFGGRFTNARSLGETLDEKRRELREGIRENLPEFVSAIDAGISYIVSRDILERNKIVADLSASIAELSLKASAVQEKSDRILDDLASLPTKLQVSNYSKLFETESENFKRSAKWWLMSTIGCLLGIVTLSVTHIWAIYSSTLAQLTLNDIIQINISKILILTALFYGLSICNKNYKMSKHNEILNKHRKNALSSFQAFVESPSADDSTKNAVLLEATRTIYGTQQTGYVVTDQDESPIKLIELINSISQKSPK
jgi:hypothetical protein